MQHPPAMQFFPPPPAPSSPQPHLSQTTPPPRFRLPLHFSASCAADSPRPTPPPAPRVGVAHPHGRQAIGGRGEQPATVRDGQEWASINDDSAGVDFSTGWPPVAEEEFVRGRNFRVAVADSFSSQGDCSQSFLRLV
ncbi:hypothetical protein E2562_014364 [Oryza meyeriana var. granulata]|uniref:Uncharacterized protein n=1 Tax=Oryza meyeriana var. granulata TaxID=110450 RepID=A0A6G1C524_9ORYZ|nr:hypothetical protein E2562_014364 [Oryza meyeriana var. granulata]